MKKLDDIQIQYTDDKKEKYQSVRATVELRFTAPMGYAEVFAEGFGASEEEARVDLLHILKHAVSSTDFWLKTQEPTRRAGPPHDK